MFIIYIITRICIFQEDANTVLLCVIVKTLRFVHKLFDGQVADQASYIIQEHLVQLSICICVNFSNSSSSSPSLMWLSSSPRQAVDFGLSREFSFKDILLSSTTTSSTASYLYI